MKPKIVANNKAHLKFLIEKEMKLNGDNCDLNHIDVCEIKTMMSLFAESKFNGDISKWDVSRVTSMGNMFYRSKFNGDISKWDVSRVINMENMFSASKFNGDISKWDVSKVKYMNLIFFLSEFDGDVSDWKPYSLGGTVNVFVGSKTVMPYWANYEDIEKRVNAIDNYHLAEKLQQDLNSNNDVKKKIKI